MVSKRNGYFLYRVSTTEWIFEDYIKPHANTNIRIQDPISVSDRRDYYTVTWRAVSGEPVYKSNGELWNYTLPNNTKWKKTATAFDQYGSSYSEVSTGAWVKDSWVF